MALGQVAARMEGDVYQGMFFWYEAASLLIPTSKVVRVGLEHDEASGVDDVAVFYAPPGVVDAGRVCTADFFQIKYHVDHRDQYCSARLIDPAFINAKRSLLERFHRAFLKLQGEHSGFRLHLASNWTWKIDDDLATVIREGDGSLPRNFLVASDGTKLGRIRETWRQHLGLDNQEFNDFVRTLRFDLNHFGRARFVQSLSDRLALAGLRALSTDHLNNPYDSLVQQFIMNGINEFDRETLLEHCKREELIQQRPAGTRVIGVRSFMRFAERMEDETDDFVCVAEYFQGRQIRDSALWNDAVLCAARRFLEDPSTRQAPHHILLDCHASLAFAAGYVLEQKSGAQVFPIQKGARREVWIPSGASEAARNDGTWSIEVTALDSSAEDLVVALSATHSVIADVTKYLQSAHVPARALINALPAGGIGSAAIHGADHAVGLADRLLQSIRNSRRGGACGTVHIFAAAPNGLMFFLGRHGSALGRVQLYEFDFEGQHGGGYLPSIRLP